ncbi:hypothetical protein [Cupriavidus malaysiensis]|uniref:Uncharacterized protein n=1 Tax=Cupriavidus malaysiensis TaxID=367825 RepID=A0ABN4THQ5_9BURK|nr:hypothetical protein [Cupriavidus malaysiensis]AOZ06732.1 hypothetical protein BKK80_13585 [Cupriavidus malaysiensis]
MPNAVPTAAAYQHAYEARQRAAGQPAPAFLAPATAPRLPRADEQSAVVMTAGEWWSVIGEFTTPGPGQAPAFVAASIRMVNADGSQGPELIDFFTAMSVAEFERLAVEFLTEGRA